MTGIIKRLVADKGFGFIQSDGSAREFFFHKTSVAGRGFDTLREGDRVEFEEEPGQKGPRAGKVRPT